MRSNVLRVIPLLSGGLHCGYAIRKRKAFRPPVIPLLSGGLHCGGAAEGD